MTEHRHPREIAKEILAKDTREFDAWAVRLESGQLAPRTFASEEEAGDYQKHIADMYFQVDAKVVRVHVEMEEIR